MLLFVTTALAAPVAGHYHPEDIQVQSEVFAKASERLSGLFEERSRSLRQLALAINQYQEALDLLGSRASDVERTRLDELRRTYARQEAEIQLVADEVVEGFDSAMVAAMERAAEPLGQVQRCKAMLDSGPRLPGVPVRQEKNPDCKGDDLNAKIADAMDADAELSDAVDAILDREWPAVTLVEEPQAPIAFGDPPTEWINARDLLIAGAKDAVQAITEHDDERREEIDAALEGDGDVDIEVLRSQVERIERQTAQLRNAMAGPILDVAELRLAKKAKEAAIGWCANPRALGGCTGKDVTQARIDLLMADKKFVKSLP